MLAIRRLTSLGLVSSDWRRAKARSRCVSAAARQCGHRGRVHETRNVFRAVPSAMRLRTRSSEPMMPVRRLLKSCAMPPVRWPIASIFCDCRSASCAAASSISASFVGRDVPAGAIHKTIFRNANPGNPAIAAILAPIAIDEADRRLADQREFKAGPRVFHIVRMQQFEDRHAGNLRLRPAQDGLPRRIGSLEISLGIERTEQIGT